MGNASSEANDRLFEATPGDEVLRQVNAGRKLVIYERETGLFAHWYIALRCEEECYRAQRYQRPLSLGVIEPSSTGDSWAISEKLAPALQDRLRKADLPGYLGTARYVLIMPETDLEGAEEVIQRIRNDVEDIQGGVASFPHDGLTFDHLYEIAARRLRTEVPASTTNEPPTPFRRIERPRWT